MQTWNFQPADKASAAVLVMALTSVLSACGGGDPPAPETPPVSAASAASVPVSGRVRYQAMASADGAEPAALKPARSVALQIVDPTGAVLASGSTDDEGRYTLAAPPQEAARLNILAVLQPQPQPQPESATEIETADARHWTVQTAPFAITAETPGPARSDILQIDVARPFALLDALLDAPEETADSVTPLSLPELAPGGRRNVIVSYKTSGIATVGKPYPVVLYFRHVGAQGARITFKNDPALKLTQAAARTMPPGASSITVRATPSENGLWFFTVYARQGTGGFAIPVPVQVGPEAPELPAAPVI